MSLIKYFESTDVGAPTLNNAAGSMIAVLDACLITGYNSKAVTSITVASGVATVVCAAHGYANTYGKAIRIAGATGGFAALNKDTHIANVTTNGFTFLCPGVADGVATGTLTAKYAPMDWVKQFSGANKAMYKRGDVTATGCMLRIDDNVVGQVCRALMVQAAADIDSYTNPAPLSAQISDGLGQFWCKGYNNATPASWFLVADDKYFYLFSENYEPFTGVYLAHGFGDIIDFKPASVLGCGITGLVNSALVGRPYYGAGLGVPGDWVISGGKNGISSSQFLCCETKKGGYGVTGPSYPSDVDGGLVVSYPVLINEGSDDGHRRGIQPGLAIPLANISGLSSKYQISNIIGSDRVFLVVQIASPAVHGAICNPLIDLTGPWR